MKKTLGVLLSLAAAIGAIAGALVVFYKVMKKHLKFTVEILPDNIDDDNELTAAVDVVDLDIPEEEEEKEEIEISFVEEDEEPTEEEAEVKAEQE